MGNKHCLIAIEGIDGSGKSVQAVLLQLGLARKGLTAVITKAKQLEQNEALAAFTEAFGIRNDSIAYMFLYQALHRQQYEQTMSALAEEKIVIADRWDMSFFLYHSLVGPMARRSPHTLKVLNKLAFENRKPDVYFYIDVPVDIAIRRRIDRGDNIQTHAAEQSFYERVVDRYKKLFEGKKYHHIDGTSSIEEVARQILSITLKHLGDD